MTRKWMLIAGAATMALSAPAMAGPKEGRGGGHATQSQDRGGGGGGRQAARASVRTDLSGGGQARMESRARVERPRMERQVRVERPRMERQARVERPRLERQHRLERPRFERQARVERQQRIERPRVERQARVERNVRVPMNRIDRQTRVERTDVRRFADSFDRKRVDVRTVERPRFANRDYDGFKNFGQAVAARAHLRNEARQEAKREWKLGERFNNDWTRYDGYMPLRYSSRYVDTPDYYYRYDGDRVYRINRNDGLLSSIFPVLGGAYSVGQPLPYYYSSSYVPMGYRSLYYDTPDHYYRYGDGGLYQVDASSGLITALVSLLAGGNFGVGSMLPASYNTYNVPYAYRDRYYDTADNWYRYNDGYIYQVDPYSRRISASYPIYGNGYYDVGQPWPAAYPDYNVPNAYRSSYYDTPQWDYRYANGAIYQVDPQTQMINALVSLVTGQPMNVGQAMPAGYGVYNVPYSYRDRYYDTADNYYRYSDGYIYRVDPYTGRIGEVIPAYA